MSKQTALRLADETYARLKKLAAHTGRTASFYMREAILLHLDELEDIYLADHALKNLHEGKDQIISGEDFWNDLEDPVS